LLTVWYYKSFKCNADDNFSSSSHQNTSIPSCSQDKNAAELQTQFIQKLRLTAQQQSICFLRPLSSQYFFCHNLPAARAREVFKPSTDSARLPVSTEKTTSQVGVFLHFYGQLYPALGANPMSQFLAQGF